MDPSNASQHVPGPRPGPRPGASAGHAAAPALRIETRTGAALVAALPALHRLRVAVFREWPYLYEGNPEFEASHQGPYARSANAAIVLALDGVDPVGAATCLPLADESEAVLAPFRVRGWDVARLFYFGEAVLLPAYRGGGAGVAFFEHREAQARRCNATHALFCVVERAADDPRRPPGAVPLDAFWRHRGYAPVPDLACTMRWRVVGEAEETPHRLAFWAKSLTGDPLPPSAPAGEPPAQTPPDDPAPS